MDSPPVLPPPAPSAAGHAGVFASSFRPFARESEDVSAAAAPPSSANRIQPVGAAQGLFSSSPDVLCSMNECLKTSLFEAPPVAR